MREEILSDLFAPAQSAIASQLMATFDAVNRKYVRGTLRAARIRESPGWSMRRELPSHGFTASDRLGLVDLSATGKVCILGRPQAVRIGCARFRMD